MAAHGVPIMFIPCTLHTFSKSSFLSSQHLKASQVRKSTAQVLTLHRKVLRGLTPAPPTLASHLHSCIPAQLCWPPPGLHPCTLAFSIPLPRSLLRNHRPQALPSPAEGVDVLTQPPKPHTPTSCSPSHFSPQCQAPQTPVH